MPSPAAKLQSLLDAPGLLVMPCCFDGLKKLVGFEDYYAEEARYTVIEDPADHKCEKP